MPLAPEPQSGTDVAYPQGPVQITLGDCPAAQAPANKDMPVGQAVPGAWKSLSCGGGRPTSLGKVSSSLSTYNPSLELVCGVPVPPLSPEAGSATGTPPWNAFRPQRNGFLANMVPLTPGPVFLKVGSSVYLHRS